MEFARKGGEVTSLDFTRLGTEYTRNLFRENDMVSSTVRAAAEALPFKQASFDCVYSFGVLHHIIEVQEVVREITRVLRPGGDLICMLYNKNSLLYAYSIIFLHRNEGLGEEEMLRKYSERILGCPHTKAYTKQQALELFAPYFQRLEANVYYDVVDLPGMRKLKLVIPDSHELGWHIIVKGERKL